MRADDCQFGKVGRYVIQINRPRVIELDSHAAGLSGSEPVRAGVKQRGHSELGDLFIEWIELLVVWIERLNAGMKLRADQAEFSDRAFHLVDRARAFQRIDAREADKLPRLLHRW